MPIREDMHGLGQEIVDSYEARVHGIAHIRKETETGRRAMETWLLEVAKGHDAMSRQLRADLSQGRAHLANGVATQLKEVGAAHQATARQQRAYLAKGQAYLKKSVGTQLRELDEAHHTLAQQQRADLGKGRRDLTQAEAQRQSQVNAWTKEVAAAHAGAQAAWQELCATMAAKRGGAVAAAPPHAAEEGEEEAVSRAQVGMVTPEFASLTDTVLEHLSSHPEGTRLTELQADFGMNRFEAARAVRRLLDQGRAEKRDLLYFAI